jgi:hypothetical protein
MLTSVTRSCALGKQTVEVCPAIYLANDETNNTRCSERFALELISSASMYSLKLNRIDLDTCTGLAPGAAGLERMVQFPNQLEHLHD